MIENKKIYILLTLVAVFWGGAFVAAKIAVVDIPPVTAAFLRFLLAGAILYPLMRRNGEHPVVKAKDLVGFLLLGFTGIFAYNALFMIGMKTTSAVNGSLIIAANPMVTTLAAGPFLKEKIAPKQIAGALISFIGVALVLTKGSFHNIRSLQFGQGDLLLLVAMFCWSAYALLGKKVMVRFSPLVSTTYACLIGAALLLPLAWKMENGFSSIRQAHLPALLAILYMAVFASVLGFVWWYRGITILGASRASAFINLVPLTAMLLSIAYGEPVNLLQVASCILVMGGIALTSRQVPTLSANAMTATEVNPLLPS